jgi:hypothetical protein
VGDSVHVESDFDFNASAGSWGTSTRMEAKDLSQPVGWAILPAGMGERIPALSGAAEARVELTGTLPPPDFDPMTSPLPVNGTVVATAHGVGVRMPMLVVEGLDTDVAATVDGSARSGDAVTTLTIDRMFHPGLVLKPMRDTVLRADLRFDDIDRLSGVVHEARLRNYGAHATGRVEVSGLQAALASEETNPVRKWLGNLDIDSAMTLRQDLLSLSGIHPYVMLEGRLESTLAMRNQPARGLELEAETTIRDGGLVFADMVEASGVTGGWRTRKTLAARDVVLDRPALPPGEFRIAEASFGPPGRPGLKANTRDVLLTMRGFDEPVRLGLEVRDLLGGNAVAQAALDLNGRDPVLSADMQVAGVDAGQLGGLSSSDLRAWEINGAGSANWRLRAVGFDRALEDLTLRADSTRIGRLALSRLLEALDADQDDPRFQNARAALRFGTPVMAQARLDNSLVTFASELRMPGGLPLALPILDRQPLGDMIEVYDFDRFSPMFSLTRTGLLVLLAEDMQELEETLATLETAP